MVQRIAASSTTLLRAKNRLMQFTIKIKRRGERKKKEKQWKKKRKRPQKHTVTPIMTLLVLLERYQQDESNDTKKCHKR
jgi:hypothetical protein